jgi:hypothetical protein
MKTIAAFEDPISAIACLALCPDSGPITASLYNHGQSNLADSIDLLRYVLGVFNLQADAVAPRDSNGNPPHMFPFLAIGRAQCKAEEIGADRIILDLSAIDELRPQVTQLAQAQVQLLTGARAAMGLPPVEVLTPVLGMTRHEAHTIAIDYLSDRLTALYTATHDDELDEFYGFEIGPLPIFDGKSGWRALDYEADRLGVPKGDTWRETIPALVEARILEIVSATQEV